MTPDATAPNSLPAELLDDAARLTARGRRLARLDDALILSFAGSRLWRARVGGGRSPSYAEATFSPQRRHYGGRVRRRSLNIYAPMPFRRRALSVSLSPA